MLEKCFLGRSAGPELLSQQPPDDLAWCRSALGSQSSVLGGVLSGRRSLRTDADLLCLESSTAAPWSCEWSLGQVSRAKKLSWPLLGHFSGSLAWIQIQFLLSLGRKRNPNKWWALSFKFLDWLGLVTVWGILSRNFCSPRVRWLDFLMVFGPESFFQTVYLGLALQEILCSRKAAQVGFLSHNHLRLG